MISYKKEERMTGDMIGLTVTQVVTLFAVIYAIHVGVQSFRIDKQMKQKMKEIEKEEENIDREYQALIKNKTV